MTTRYRIVETDNYDGDWPDESFVSLPLLEKADAERVARHINACFPQDHHRYWKVVPDGYMLRLGFEP